MSIISETLKDPKKIAEFARLNGMPIDAAYRLLDTLLNDSEGCKKAKEYQWAKNPEFAAGMELGESKGYYKGVAVTLCVGAIGLIALLARPK